MPIQKSKTNLKKDKTAAPKKKRSISKLLIFLFFFTFVAFSAVGQETIEWINSYSSKDFEGNDQREVAGKTYFYWQISSLKKPVAPRYIKLIDVGHYANTGKFINAGILFTYNGLKNSEVSICGNFTSWRCIPMIRNRYGVYHTVIPVNFKDRNEEEISNYEYKFKVDGLFDFDNENPSRRADGEGSYYSEYILETVDFEKQVSSEVMESEMEEDMDFHTVEFRIHKPEASVISLVGDFNGWNPEHDYLRKDKDGIFRLRKKLKPGEYLYHYVIDGEKVLDTYNSETRFRADTEELVSFLFVKATKLSSL